MRLEDNRICRSPGGLIPPREGRVRAKRGGRERVAFATGFSPPGSLRSPPSPRGEGAHCLRRTTHDRL
jgi:hypothetical protein